MVGVEGDTAMRLRASAVFALACIVSVTALSGLLFSGEETVVPEATRRAQLMQSLGEPVAVIAPLPPEVSNGTLRYLDASGSEPSSNITNYTWEIFYKTGNTTTYVYARRVSYLFSSLGLYMITLTVTDKDGRSDSAFTAVYAILDSDVDGLPDWWEMKYFYSLDESGSGDSDGDGWTNLREYANDMDPTTKDPQPGLIQELKKNWYYIVIIAAAIVVAILLMLPVMKRKRKEEEKKKIKAALEIEKALEEE